MQITLIRLVGYISFAILVPVAIVILIYLIKIARLLARGKTIEPLSYHLTDTIISPDKKAKLEKIREKTENEDIKAILDTLLETAPVSEVKTPVINRSVLETKKEEKAGIKKDTKGWSRARLAYEKAMQENDPEKRIPLLQKVVTKYFDSEWADKALEEIIKAKQGK